MSTPKRIGLPSLSALPAGVASFSEAIGAARIICFWGGMGFGKTTFIKALCQHWGVLDSVTSPTFSLVNEYRTAKGDPIFHIDFYRVQTLEEAWDLGCEDIFSSASARVLIEWPSLVEPLLPDDRLDVALRVHSTGEREVILNAKE